MYRLRFAALLVALPVAGAQTPPPSRAEERIQVLLDSLHVPSAVVTITRGDSVVMLRGFGRIGGAQGPLPDPNRTLYRTASVAKVFVATVALQLSQQGVLQLDRDIRSYLGASFPPLTEGDSLTLWNLLTHTAGFDERVIGYAAAGRDSLRTLDEYLRSRLPARGWRPGEIISYSNHGMALAALVAERAAKTPFATLADQQLFLPLGMTSTYYVGSPREPQNPPIATGQRCDSAGCTAVPTAWSHTFPVGLAYATAADMSRFLLAFANGGVVHGDTLLSPAVVQTALSRRYSHDPRLPGIGAAFLEQEWFGYRVMGHAGGVPGVATTLAIVPEERLGVYIAANASSPQFVRQALSVILQANLPRRDVPRVTAAGPVSEYAGNWRQTRYSHRTVERFTGAFVNNVVAWAAGDTLLLRFGSVLRRFVRTDSLLLQDTETGVRAVLRRDSGGHLTHLLLSAPAGGADLPVAMERVRWFEVPHFLNEYVSWLLLGPLLALIAWGVYALAAFAVRRWRSVEAKRVPWRGKPVAALLVAPAYACLFTVFGFGFIARVNAELSSGGGAAVYGLSPTRIALLRSAWLLIALAIAMAWFAIHAWRGRWWSIAGRLFYTIATLGALLTAHFLLWWRFVPGRV